MDFTASKKDLMTHLARVASVAESKSTSPILACVYLSAELGAASVRVVATDLYLWLIDACPATIGKDGAGSVAIPAKPLLERVRMMPMGDIQFSTSPKGVVMKAKGEARRYTLASMPGDDYPPLPEVKEGAPVATLPAKVLLDLVCKTEFSISPDETRAHLNAALLEWDGPEIRMVSTDGHRLSLATVKLTDRIASMQLLLSRAGIKAIGRLLDDVSAGGDVDLRLIQSGSSLHIETGKVSLVTRMVDAQFPPYRQVIPDHLKSSKVRLVRAQFADALRASAVAAEDRSGAVRMQIKDEVMHLSAASANGGEADDEIPVQHLDARTKALLCCNASYLLEALDALETNEVEVRYAGELDPIVLLPVEAEGFLGVIMPVRA